MPEKEYQKQLSRVTASECLCIGLSNAAALNYECTLVKNLDAVNVCPGPNIAYFNKVVSLQTMTDHIYGRTNIMEDANRPNMFIAELNLYTNFLKEELENEDAAAIDHKRKKHFDEFFKNLQDGILYYKNLPETVEPKITAFRLALDITLNSLRALQVTFSDYLPEKITSFEKIGIQNTMAVAI